jgi:transposase-like protein
MAGLLTQELVDYVRAILTEEGAAVAGEGVLAEVAQEFGVIQEEQIEDVAKAVRERLQAGFADLKTKAPQTKPRLPL